MKAKKKLIVIVGPTAVGKTSVAIGLARQFGTEIISADSRQIYREMNIGTAKPSILELAEINHHFVNSHSITEDYDAAAFGEDALKIIEKLFEDHDRVIMCGGSGLYVKAVCEGFDEIPALHPTIRQQVVAEYETNGLESLQTMMQTLDPDHYKSIDVRNPQRLIRALEVRIGTGQSIRHFQQGKKRAHQFEIVKIGLELPREELFQRIDARMDEMITAGLFEEASALFTQRSLNALQTVGYQEIFGFMEGKYGREEAVRLLKRNSRHYAKRQITWFKRDAEIIWTDPANIDNIKALATEP